MKAGAKRFYKSADAAPRAGGFAIELDGRPVKTPGGAGLVAPTRALGSAIAAEWNGQGEKIDPASMPLTKLLNTAIDRIAVNRAAIVADIAKYAGTDLLCYRAAVPDELVRRQSASWDRWLAWGADELGVRLAVTEGVGHIEQPQEALDAVRRAVEVYDGHRLLVLHTAVSITGSAVLGLALLAGAHDALAAFATSRIDEDFQAEKWGRDAEAEARARYLLNELTMAARYLELL